MSMLETKSTTWHQLKFTQQYVIVVVVVTALHHNMLSYHFISYIWSYTSKICCVSSNLSMREKKTDMMTD